VSFGFCSLRGQSPLYILTGILLCSFLRIPVRGPQGLGLRAWDESSLHFNRYFTLLFFTNGGSASAFQSGKNGRIEGKKNLIPLKDHSILDEFSGIRESLQSAISYGGGKNLSCFKDVRYF
jgi:hypothetical protein